MPSIEKNKKLSKNASQPVAPSSKGKLPFQSPSGKIQKLNKDNGAKAKKKQASSKKKAS